MDWNSYLFLSQVLILIVVQSNGYVLLAGNLDDFRSIARKFVPGKLAKQLAELASQSAVNYRESKAFNVKTKVSVSESSEEAEKSEEFHERDEKQMKRIPDVDFEELVQKVKERLQKDFIDKPKERLRPEPLAPDKKDQNKGANSKSSFNDRENVARFNIARFEQPNNKYLTDETKKNKEDNEDESKVPTKKYQEYNVNVREEEGKVDQDSNGNQEKEMIEIEEKLDDAMTFSRIQISNNDSYEDYVTPERAKNVFESDSEKFSVASPDTYMVTAQKAHIYTNDYAENVRQYEVADIKAQSETLQNDYKAADDEEDYDQIVTPLRKTTKLKPNTMIPKRDFYKMSTPNYFGKVPIVAESYNFNEPIPERDREPEKIRPIPYPPSVINGKVRFIKKR